MQTALSLTALKDGVSRAKYDEDAVLILSSEDDPEFISKWTSAICVNLFLADLVGETFPQFKQT